MKYICIFIVLLVLSSVLKVNAQGITNSLAVPIFQPSPAGPSIDMNNWVLDSALSDEFNRTDSIDNDTLFLYQDDCLPIPSSTIVCAQPTNIHNYEWYTGFNWRGKQNTKEDDGANLILRVEKNTSGGFPCTYTDVDGPPTFFTGEVQSAGPYYQYGYYEIYAKLPGFIDSITGKPTGFGMYPTFWTDYSTQDCHMDSDTCCYGYPYGGCCPYRIVCYSTHDEVDILEPSGTQYVNADSNIYGVWHEYGAFYPCNIGKAIQGRITSADPLFEGYHKFGLELLSDRIYFYFDDQPYGWQLNDPLFPVDRVRNAFNDMHKMYVKISYGIDESAYLDAANNFQNQKTINKYQFSNPDSTARATSMYVDYFHYYVLKYDCGTDALISNDSEFTTFTTGVIGVKNTITLDGSNINEIDLASTDNFTFRADSEITIKPPFNAPSGSVLNLIITPCDPH